MNSSKFKNTSKNDEEMRLRRRTDRVELRKKEREDASLKRRNVSTVEQDPAQDPQTLQSRTTAFLAGILTGIKGEDTEAQIYSTGRLRRLLSQANQVETLVDDVIALDIIPNLVVFLDRDDAPTLQFEAAWCLTNIASGEEHQTQAVVDAGAVPKFACLLSSVNKEVREQALWAIGNIAGDGPTLRDALLDLGIVDPVLAMLQPGATLSCMRTATWTLANLCRGRPPPDYERVRAIVQPITHLATIDDEQILIDAAWALSYLTDGENDQIQDVIDTDITQRLVDLLSLGDHELQKPTLRALGNIVTGDADQTQTVLDCRPLPVLLRLLNSPREYIRKECCWALSNILAGTPEQIAAVVDENIIPVLIRSISAGEAKVRREAAWAITNMICGGTVEQVKYVIELGCIPPLVSVLDSQDAKLIQVTLDGIREILRFGALHGEEHENMCAQWVEEAGGVPRIELLQRHENTKIYQKAYNIISTFFSDDVPEDLDYQGPPVTANGSLYGFDAQPQPGNYKL